MLNVIELLRKKCVSEKEKDEVFQKVTSASIDELLQIDYKEAGNNALHIAVKERHLKIVAALIPKFKEAGKLGVRNKQGDTALHFAILYEDNDTAFAIAEELTNNQLLEFSETFESPIRCALHHNYRDIALYFLRRLNNHQLFGKQFCASGDTVYTFCLKKNRLYLFNLIDEKRDAVKQEAKVEQKAEVAKEVLFIEGLANDERVFYLNMLYSALGGLKKDNWHHTPLNALISTAIGILETDKGFVKLDGRFDELRADQACNTWIKKLEDAKAAKQSAAQLGAGH